MARAKPRNVESTIADAVSFAFGEIESIKDELQEWYDNLPESFQNGSKGDMLQETVSALEGSSEPDVPDEASGIGLSYTEWSGRIGRPKRRDACVSAINAAAEAARDFATKLGDDPTYNEEGQLVVNEVVITEENDSMDTNPEQFPVTESERDSLVTDLETLADECENAGSDWENAEFPGMYG